MSPVKKNGLTNKCKMPTIEGYYLINVYDPQRNKSDHLSNLLNSESAFRTQLGQKSYPNN